jgi:flagellar L-ring protein precursor FlgH
MKNRAILCALAAALAAAGCAANKVQIHEPVTARPEPVVRQPAVTGGIYQAASYRPLFEDRRARFVGDTLLVSISERLSASSTTSGNVSRAASTAFSVPKVARLPIKTVQDANLQASASTKIEEKDEAVNDNLFSGAIMVTVIEVLPNGHLLVSGDKQIGVNGEVDTLRFSGVVNPITIQSGNVVASNQVADARIEAVSRSTVDAARVAGFLGRFFMSFIPFR